MADHDESALEEELAKFEQTCKQAAQALASSRSVREAYEAGEVDVPHHLRAIVRVKVPTYGRLARARDRRIEEIVKDQLSSLQIAHSDFAASRDFDRIKAIDWYVLRANYPDLYSKSVKEANLIIERKKKTKR
jgi:hypothetical protein